MAEEAKNISRMLDEKLLKINSGISVLITRSKNRSYKKRIISHLLDIQEPIQSDIEHFLSDCSLNELIKLKNKN